MESNLQELPLQEDVEASKALGGASGAGEAEDMPSPPPLHSRDPRGKGSAGITRVTPQTMTTPPLECPPSLKSLSLLPPDTPHSCSSPTVRFHPSHQSGSQWLCPLCFQARLHGRHWVNACFINAPTPAQEGCAGSASNQRISIQ